MQVMCVEGSIRHMLESERMCLASALLFHDSLREAMREDAFRR